MTPIKRSLGAVGATLLLAASISACGGGASGAPDDASAEDYCSAFAETPEGLDSDDSDEAADAAKDWAKDLEETGTPEDIDGDAREGFEIFVDYLSDIDGGDVEDLSDSDDPADVFDGDDADKVEEFITKTGEVCAEALGGGVTE